MKQLPNEDRRRFFKQILGVGRRRGRPPAAQPVQSDPVEVALAFLEAYCARRDLWAATQLARGAAAAELDAQIRAVAAAGPKAESANTGAPAVESGPPAYRLVERRDVGLDAVHLLYRVTGITARPQHWVLRLQRHDASWAVASFVLQGSS